MTVPMTSRPREASATRRTAVLGIGVLTACAVACSLPFLVGAGVLASGAAFVAGSAWLALAALGVAGLAVGAALVVRRRRAATAATGAGACDCGGACAR
jgi:hypothetical protein